MAELECLLDQKKIDILEKKEHQLTKKEVKASFFYQNNEYIDYMTQDKITAYFLKSHNRDLDEEIFLMKNSIRKKYQVTNKDMKNLLHGAHCGTEFFWQRRILFPEYENYEHTSYADLLVPFPGDIKKFRDKYNEVRCRSKLVKYGLVLDEKDKIFLSEIKSSIAQNIPIFQSVRIQINQMNVELLSLKQENGLSKTFVGAIDGFDFIPEEAGNMNTLEYINNSESVVCKLKEIIIFLNIDVISISGLVINTVNMSLNEAEVRYEAAKSLNIILIGGSYDWNSFGLFGMSSTKTNKALTLLGY